MTILDSIERFFVSWRFPVVVISGIGFFVMMLLAILLIPDSTSAAAAFAEDFKVWCLGYDPATGQMEWAYVWMFAGQPLVLIGVVLLVWGGPLKEVLTQAPARIWPYVGSTLVTVGGLGVALVLLAGANAQAADPSFPAERIRTTHTPPAFALTNQDSETVTLASLRGRVVLVTAVYASCSYTCPMILAQTKKALAALTPEERADLTVVAITLDPEHDTPGVLNALTKAQRVEAPLFHALTGEPGTVNAVLDRYGFARTRDPETGVIDHTNLFILIDRAGRIAYRFSLGERQTDWLIEGLRLLIEEQGSQEA